MRSLYDSATATYNREVPHDYAVMKTTTASPIADILTPMTSGGTSVGGLDILGDWIKFVVTLVIILINLFSALF